MSLRPPRGFHHFIRDRVVPAFKEQRGINQNQFAVLLLVSENEFKDLNSMEFHPSEEPLTDCCEVSMPHERSQYRNYIVARYESIRDSDEVSTDYHSEETIVSELDHLWEGYMEFTNGTPPTCFILYSWNFPCTDCTETIISALKRPPYKGISMIVVFSQHWRGETSRDVYHNRKEMKKKGIYFTKVNGVKLNDSDDSSESESDDSDIIDGDADADSDDQYDFDDNIDWGNIPDTHDDDHDLSDLQDCDDRSDDHNDTYDFDDDDPDIDDLQGFDDDHDNSYDVTDNSDEDSIASSDHDDTYDFDDDDPDIDDLQGFDDDHDNSYYDVTDNSDEDSSDHDDITDFDESETDDNGFLYDTNETIVYNMVLYMCSNIIDAGLDSDDSYDTSGYDDEYEDY